MTLTATIIIDPDGITMIVGKRKFVVRGALARGLRSIAAIGN